MTKTTKLVLIAIVLCSVLFLLAVLSDTLVPKFLGKDGICDYCFNKAGIVSDGKEYCASCFAEYDGNYWN